jgi:branched-chain amino acid transport system permease protein
VTPDAGAGDGNMELLQALVAPFADMAGSPRFLVEVLIGGVASGLLYSLVALGFVLIFKASGVFNFAQGVMVLFAALTLVGLMERGVPAALALPLTVVVMIALAFAIERIVLRPLVNQEYIILFMATIGLNFFLEGFGELLWGANVKKLDVGIPDTSFKVAGVLVNRLELAAAVTAAVLVTVLAVFFQKTRIGRATTRRRSASASRSRPSGSWSGRRRAWSPWRRGSCGGRRAACSSVSR